VLRAGVGELVDVLGDAIGALVEVDDQLVEIDGGFLVEAVGEILDRARRLVEIAALAISTAGQVLDAGEDSVDALRILRQRRGESLDVLDRALERAAVLADEIVDPLQHLAGPLCEILRRSG
jgi:hypothetical protein